MRKLLSVPALTAAMLTTFACSQTKAAVSLSGWNLTLPTDSSGELSGKAAAGPADLHSPYLTQTSDGALSFWAPSVGATTAHSKHSRTELVQASSWTLGSTQHTLSATLHVVQLPSVTPDIIIGQIHGAGPIPYLMLHYQNGIVVAKWRNNLAGTAKTGSQTLLTDVPLNATFSYSITAETGNTVQLTASYNGATADRTVTVPAEFVGAVVRFQAGDYQQATTSSGSADGGRVVFSTLSAT
jgi:hypothetical protein